MKGASPLPFWVDEFVMLIAGNRVAVQLDKGEAGGLDQMRHLGGSVAVLGKYAIMKMTYCYNWITCGCELEIGSEAAITRNMHVAMGPLP